MNTPLASIPAPFVRASAILSLAARQRCQTYRWLALSFYPPDEELAQAIQTGRIARELLTEAGWLGKDADILEPYIQQLSAHQGTTLSHLKNDYARLFGKGLERVSPRASAYFWRDASHMLDTGQEMNISLRQIYSHFGLTPIEGMEDHVAVQLEFLSFLCEREAGYWESLAQKTARELRREEATFLEDHLGRWLPEFFWRVHRRLPDSIYAVFAGYGDTWIALDQGPKYLARSG